MSSSVNDILQIFILAKSSQLLFELHLIASLFCNSFTNAPTRDLVFSLHEAHSLGLLFAFQSLSCAAVPGWIGAPPRPAAPPLPALRQSSSRSHICPRIVDNSFENMYHKIMKYGPGNYFYFIPGPSARCIWR